MEINKLFIFIATAIVLGYISATQSSNEVIRELDENESCNVDDDCFELEACENKKCVPACEVVKCEDNSWCNVIDHVGVCTCFDNTIPEPGSKCKEESCTINDDCQDYEKCENNQCVDACESFSCGNNTRCKSVSHEAYCVCEFGLVGDPTTKCGKKSCSTHSECFFTDKCENNECIKACEGTTCGTYALCVVNDHIGICTCHNQYIGDPHVECVRQNCTKHDDCYLFEKCESNQCIDACDFVTCGENAMCNGEDHVPQCRCPFRMTGDPLVKCVKEVCTDDSDCATSEYCNINKCTQACDDVLCVHNSFCDVKNHTASCVCMEKYIGDPQTGCVRQSCSTSEDCHLDERCEDTVCISACDVIKCGKNARCTVDQHIANCSCLSGFIGDPSVACERKNCATNADCSGSEKCENKKCIDACEDSFCPFNTMCKAQNHTVNCACFEKHDGDAYSGCVRQSCNVDNDCFKHETCENNKCVPACESVKCEGNSWCNVTDHVGVCTCFDNTIPEPGSKCKEVSGVHILPPVPYTLGSTMARAIP